MQYTRAAFARPTAARRLRLGWFRSPAIKEVCIAGDYITASYNSYTPLSAYLRQRHDEVVNVCCLGAGYYLVHGDFAVVVAVSDVLGQRAVE